MKQKQPNNLVDTLISELLTDTIDHQEKTGSLINYYKNSDFRGRQAIDRFLMILSGHNMPSLIRKMKG